MDIKIKGEFTPDPNVCKFSVNRSLLPDYSVSFKSAEEAAASPLAAKLFEVDGVSEIKIAGESVWVTKGNDESWPRFAQQLLPLIKEMLSEEQSIVSEELIASLKERPLAENLEELIEGLLEGQINPILASHGGWVRLDRIEDRDVYIEMGGGCQGCSASKVTMKHGVEKAIREIAPQVREVIDMTDHASGENPYYE